MLKQVLFFIGITFTNFIVPDFGLQFAVSFFIGMLLPLKIVKPINKILLKIPPIKTFSKKMKKHKRLRLLIPRILAGYLFTYLIGAISLALSFLL